MKDTLRRWMLHILALLFMMTIPACSRAYPATPLPALTPPPGATRQPTQTAPSPTVSPTRPVTSTSIPTKESLPTLLGQDVLYEDVQFKLPQGLASTVQPRVAPGFDQLGELYPAYTEFTLADYD